MPITVYMNSDKNYNAYLITSFNIAEGEGCDILVILNNDRRIDEKYDSISSHETCFKILKTGETIKYEDIKELLVEDLSRVYKINKDKFFLEISESYSVPEYGGIIKILNKTILDNNEVFI